jgi:hypothetical protein
MASQSVPDKIFLQFWSTKLPSSAMENVSSASFALSDAEEGPMPPLTE